MTTEAISEIVMVGGSTRIPKVREIVEEFFGKQPDTSINPDEAIAMGAAIQSGVISGDIKEVLLLDVIPLTLGIELAGGVYKPMIERNSTIPSHASRKFTTVVDNQQSILVRVLQGERRIASENHFLAEFRLLGIPPAPKELPEIEVHFSVDANGILSVTAVDLSTGFHTDVSVENYGNIGVSEDEVKRRVKDAEENLEKDEQYMRFAESRNNVLHLQRRVDRIFEFGADYITEPHARTLKESVFKLDLALDKYDLPTIQNLKGTVEDLLIDYENHPDIERQLRLNDSIDESLIESSNDQVPKISSEYSIQSNDEFSEIEAELSSMMEESEKLLNQEEESSSDDESLLSDDSSEQTISRKKHRARITSKKVEKTKTPASAETVESKKTSTSSQDKSKPSKKFAFAPPKIEDPDDNESEFDLDNAPPPPPA